MKIVVILMAMFAAGCGQTGSLYLPEDSVETPVEIRAPSEPDDDEEKKKDTQPPGG